MTPPKRKDAVSARRNVEQKHYREAIVEYAAILKRDAGNVEALKQIGLAYHAMQDPRRAFPFLSKAVSLAPGDRSLRVTFGRVCLAVDNANGARRLAVDNLESDPTDLDSLSLLVDASRGDTEQADAAKRLAAVSPTLADNYRFHLISGDLALLQGHADAAAKAYARAAEPQDANAMAELGWVAYQRHDYKWAMNLLQQSADRLANAPTVRYRLGLACYATGHVPEAMKALSQALDRQPDFPEAPQAKRILELDRCTRGVRTELVTVD